MPVRSARWCALLSPMSGSGRTWARPTSASSRRSTPSPTPRRRFSRAPTRRPLLVANADDERIAARTAGFAGRTVTFGIERDADVQGARRGRPRHRRHVARGSRRRRRDRPSPPLIGRGNLVERPRGDRGGARVRRAAGRDSRASCAAEAGGAPRRGRAPARWRDGDRRQLQRQPDRDQARARGAGAKFRDAGGWRSSARCSSSALERSALHEDVGRAAAAAPVDLLFAVGGAPATRWPARRLPPECRPTRVRHFATSDAAADAVAVAVQAGRSGAGEGIARRQNGSRGRSVEGGAGLMLYQLLYRFHTYPSFSVLNVTRYITFRTAAATLSALAISLVFGPWLIRKLREFQIGQVMRADGPQTPPAEGRHADDGRTADSDGGAGADAAVGGSHECLRVDRGADDGGIRGDRLRRRLPEDRPSFASRTAAALQDGIPDPDRGGGRRRPARSCSTRASTAPGWSFRSSRV